MTDEEWWDLNGGWDTNYTPTFNSGGSFTDWGTYGPPAFNMYSNGGLPGEFSYSDWQTVDPNFGNYSTGSGGSSDSWWKNILGGGNSSGGSGGSSGSSGGTNLGGLAGGLTSLFSSLFGGGQSNQQKQSTELISSLVKYLQAMAAGYAPYATSNMNTSQQAYGQALNFWTPLLNGSRSAASSVLAPDISRINEQYDSILQGTKGERTGAGASLYAAAPYQKQAQIQSLFSSLRPTAAKEIGNIGQQTGALGNQTFQSMISALGQALGGGSGLLGQANTAYSQSKDAGKTFGSSLSSIFDILGPLLNNKNSSTSTSNTTASGTPGSIFGDIWG